MSKKGRRAKSKKRVPSVAPPRSVGAGSMAPGSVGPAQPAPVTAEASRSEPPSPVVAADERTPEAVTAEVSRETEVSPQASSASSERPEEESFPPVESAPEPHDLDHHFFDAPASSSHAPHPELADEPEQTDPRLALRHSLQAARRRQEFAKYVKVAVGVAAGVCLLAAAKVMLLKGGAPGTDAHADEPPAQAAAITPPPPAAEPSPVPSATPEVPSVVATSAATPVAAASPLPSAETAPTADPKEALKARAATQRALDRGQLPEAIASGEKSVALDPTDSHAWLLLGAAYQEKGDLKNARRCYKSCIDQGKHGDKSECAAMLR